MFGDFAFARYCAKFCDRSVFVRCTKMLIWSRQRPDFNFVIDRYVLRGDDFHLSYWLIEFLFLWSSFYYYAFYISYSFRLRFFFMVYFWKYLKVLIQAVFRIMDMFINVTPSQIPSRRNLGPHSRTYEVQKVRCRAMTSEPCYHQHITSPHSQRSLRSSSNFAS